MRVMVEYAAQMRRAAGVASENVEVDSPCSLRDLLHRVAQKHGDRLDGLLFDTQGDFHRSILLFVGDKQTRWDDAVELNDRDTVTILTPISGG